MLSLKLVEILHGEQVKLFELDKEVAKDIIRKVSILPINVWLLK
jgi:hypothetical protein